MDRGFSSIRASPLSTCRTSRLGASDFGDLYFGDGLIDAPSIRVAKSIEFQKRSAILMKMKNFILKYGRYWLMNFAAIVLTWIAFLGTIQLIQKAMGKPSGPYLGQFLLWPGLFFVSWALVTILAYKTNLLKDSKTTFYKLNSESTPVKFLILMLFMIITKQINLSSTSQMLEITTIAILVFFYGIADGLIADSERPATSAHRIAAIGFLITGVLLIVTGTPLYGIVFR
jgi:hypothetical protein